MRLMTRRVLESTSASPFLRKDVARPDMTSGWIRLGTPDFSGSLLQDVQWPSQLCRSRACKLARIWTWRNGSIHKCPHGAGEGYVSWLQRDSLFRENFKFAKTENLRQGQLFRQVSTNRQLGVCMRCIKPLHELFGL